MNQIDLAYKNFCKERFALASPEDLVRLEDQIGIVLPDHYREYVIGYNGGYFTEPDILPPVPGCPIDALTFMHGIGASHPTAELGTERELSIFKERIEEPPDVVPIGYTLMGHFILVVTQDDGRGTILLRTFEESFVLADNIEEFFQLLREPE